MTVSARPLDRSAELLARAAELIPAYTQTLSKNPTQWVRGVAPAYVSRASGAHVWDVDGNRYVDFPMALGPVILGHAHPAVNEAITRQLEDGIVFTLPHPIEIDVAERIVERVPGAERVRFGKSGSDVTSAAIRLARACTGRDRVLVGGYHGWHDWYVGTTTRDYGVPEAVKALTGTFTFGEVPEVGPEVAAVILEPAGVTEPEPGYLQSLVDAAHAAGALVVFDEIITGFRLAPGGAQERYGVRADLVTFGKALGNGMPVSALAGRAELMDRLEDVFFSGTHGGETLSLAAARATLDELTPDAFAELHANGERLRAAVQAGIESTGVGDWVSIDGAAPRTVVLIREPEGDAPGLMARSLVQQEMLKRGVLFNGNNFICLAHTDEDLDQAAAAYEAAFARLADALSGGDLAALLEGEPVQPAFRPVS